MTLTENFILILNKKKNIFTIILFIEIWFLLFSLSPDIDLSGKSLDDMYVLTLGKLFLLGQFPSVDIVSIFGPMFSFIYGLALSIVHTPLAINLVGVTGYSFSIIMLLIILRKENVGIPLTIIILIFSILLIPFLRMFRWFEWLLPLVMLYGIQVYRDKPSSRNYLELCISFLSFVTLLFRIDLFFVVFPSALAGIAVVNGNNFRKYFSSCSKVIIYLIVIVILWLAILYFKQADIRQYLYLLIISPFYHTTRNHGIGAFNLPVFYLAAMACFYVAALIVALKNLSASHASIMFSSAIAGLLLIPTAVYLPNINHVLFIIAPILITFPLLSKSLGNKINLYKFTFTILGLILIASISYTGRKVGINLGISFFEINPLQKIKSIEKTGSPSGSMMHRIKALKNIVPNNEFILMVANPFKYCDVFFFERRVAGLDVSFSRIQQPHETLIQYQADAIAERQPFAVMVSRENLNWFYGSLNLSKLFVKQAYSDDNFLIFVRE